MYGGNGSDCHGGGRGGPGGGRGGPGGGCGGPRSGRCGPRGKGAPCGPWGSPLPPGAGPWGGPPPPGARPWGGPPPHGAGPWGGHPGSGPWGGPPGPGSWGSPPGGGCPPSTPPLSTPVKKLEAQGGETGVVWDDGHHDDLKKVYVGQGQDGISAVKFEYINGSQVIFGDQHGKPTLLGYEEFELEAGEYITSVEGTYDKTFGHASAILTMLLFKTNLNKTKGPFGIETQSRFQFKEEGYKITGFHGRAAGDVVHAIGAYLTPIGTTPLKPATPA